MSDEKKDVRVEIAKIDALRVVGTVWIGKGIAIAGLWIGLGVFESVDTTVQTLGLMVGIATTVIIIGLGNAFNIVD